MSNAGQLRPNPLVAGLHFRGKLPHLKKEGAVYFITFRLGDSLPAHQVARLKHERQSILEQARAAKSPLTWHDEQQLLAWYCDKVEKWLDAQFNCRGATLEISPAHRAGAGNPGKIPRPSGTAETFQHH